MQLILLGLLFFLGFTIFSKGYYVLQPNGNLYRNTVAKINEYLKSIQGQLVNFDSQELDLLSGNAKDIKKLSTNFNGVLTSIYNEPFIALYNKFFNTAKKEGVIGIATRHHTYMYLLKKDHTDVFIDDQPYGTIRNFDHSLVISADQSVPVRVDDKSETQWLLRYHHDPMLEIRKDISIQKVPQRIIDVFGIIDSKNEVPVYTVLFYRIALQIQENSISG